MWYLGEFKAFEGGVFKILSFIRDVINLEAAF